jgi:endonuclease G
MKKISGVSLRSASVIVSLLASLIISLIVSFAGGVISPTISNAQNTACSHHFAEQKAPIITKPALQTKTLGLCFEAFAVLHSGVSRTPLWSAEYITRASLRAAREVQREDNFHAETSLPQEDQAQLSDYAHSGFDRGHMSPAADMPTVQAQIESFSLANIVPQNRQNNQLLWAAIESATRHIVQQRGELYVITGPLFEGEQINRINNRVFIPTHIFKAVYDPQAKESAAWLAPNVEGNAYQVMSVAELEKRLNINLFPAIPDSVKSRTMELPEPRIRLKR